MKNILSIDLESWIHFEKYLFRRFECLSAEGRKKQDNWYIPTVVERILDLLDNTNQKATFFIVSEIYDWYPDIVEKIAMRGHEIGYHTNSHVIIGNAEGLEEELKKSTAFIKKFNPKGFRAPQMHITEDVYKVLSAYNFIYSSSTYGFGETEYINSILEIPVSAISLFPGRKERKFPRSLVSSVLDGYLPFGSGLAFVFLRSQINNFIKYFNKKGKPAIIIIHPWQLFTSKEASGFIYRLKVFLRHPLYFPYTFGVLNSFVKLIKKNNFTSFNDFFRF